MNDDNEALVVDPGSDAEGIIAIIEHNNCQPLAVLATHAHFDHVGAVAEVIGHYSIPFYLHRSDRALLKRMNLFKMVVEKGSALRIPDITHDLSKMGVSFSIGGFTIEVMTTPGHTPGGVCLLIDGNIFTGDTVLPEGVGRTDLPGGDPDALAFSVDRLEKLSGALVAHPGHGPSMPLELLLAMAKKEGSIGVKGI